MKADSINIPVEVDLNIKVSDETVKTCLRLIECWLNEDEKRTIRGGMRFDDGKIEPLQIFYKEEG